MKNPMGKYRTGRPYLTVVNGHFTYNVMKAYSGDPEKPGARWFLATMSDYTFGSWELGDGYVKDVRGTVTFRDPSVPDSALPSWLS